MLHSRRHACGSCQTCGRTERAHRSLQNRRRFRTAPTRLIGLSLRQTRKTNTSQIAGSATHRFCGGGNNSLPSRLQRACVPPVVEIGVRAPGPGNGCTSDFRAARFVRLVGDRVAVPRELRTPFLELRLDHRKRLSQWFHRQCPQIVPTLRTDVPEEDEAPVGRPVIEKNIREPDAGCREEFLLLGAGG